MLYLLSVLLMTNQTSSWNFLCLLAIYDMAVPQKCCGNLQQKIMVYITIYKVRTKIEHNIAVFCQVTIRYFTGPVYKAFDDQVWGPVVKRFYSKPIIFAIKISGQWMILTAISTDWQIPAHKTFSIHYTIIYFFITCTFGKGSKVIGPRPSLQIGTK